MGQELGRRRGELGCRGGNASQAGRRALRDDSTVMNQHPLEQSKAPAELDQLRGLVSDLPPFWALATTSERGSSLSLEAAYWGPFPPVQTLLLLIELLHREKHKTVPGRLDAEYYLCMHSSLPFMPLLTENVTFILIAFMPIFLTPMLEAAHIWVIKTHFPTFLANGMANEKSVEVTGWGFEKAIQRSKLSKLPFSLSLCSSFFVPGT